MRKYSTYRRDEDRVVAISWDDAERQIEAKGLGKTHTVAGRLVAEMPCDETGRADWDKAIDYDLIEAN